MKKIITNSVVITLILLFGFYVGVYTTRYELLKPYKVEFIQHGEAGYIPPHLEKGMLLDTQTWTDTVPHGGSMYLPTKYKYTYEITPKDYVK